MNFYKRHLGDYAKDTGHLSMLEQGAYNLLLDRYYATEKPIPAKDAYKVCRAASKQERDAVDGVLSEFFKKNGYEWRHAYADRVIADAQEKAESSRINGKRGGRPPNSVNVPQRTEPIENPAGSEMETQQVIFGEPKKTLASNHKPVTNNQEEKSKAPVPDDSGTQTDCPHEAIVALYHEKLPQLRSVREWTDARKTLLRSRWREKAERQNLQWWAEFFAYVGTCPLLIGNHESKDHPGWQADLEWLLRPSNFVKVIEGKYESKQAA